VVIHGEGRVSQAGQARGDLLGMFGEAGPLVADQNSRLPAGALVVDRKLADHPDAVSLVGDVVDAHGSSVARTLTKGA
jgi:hypothetical protein